MARAFLFCELRGLAGWGAFGGGGWDGLLCLGGLGHGEVAFHEGAGLGGIAGGDGAGEVAVELDGLTEIAGLVDGLAAFVVEGGDDGFHHGGKDGIAGGLGDDAVETEIVEEEGDGIVDGGGHLNDFGGEGDEVLFAAAFGGESGELAFDDAASLEHLPGLKVVEGAEEREGGLAQFGRAVGDKGADAVANIENAHGDEIADAGAEAGAADAELAREFALGRDAAAGLQRSGLDQGTDVMNDAHGHVGVGIGGFVARSGGNPGWRRREGGGLPARFAMDGSSHERCPQE